MSQRDELNLKLAIKARAYRNGLPISDKSHFDDLLNFLQSVAAKNGASFDAAQWQFNHLLYIASAQQILELIEVNHFQLDKSTTRLLIDMVEFESLKTL